MKGCNSCGNTDNLIIKKVKVNNLILDMIICPRCNNVSFALTKQSKNKLFKQEAKKELNKAIKEIVKDAN